MTPPNTVLNFSANDLNMWGSGRALTYDRDFSYTFFDYRLSNSETMSFGSTGNSLTAAASAYANAKLTGGLHLSSGDVDLSYPINARVDYPELVRSGNTVRIDTSDWALTAPTLQTASPFFDADVDFSYTLGAELNVSANLAPIQVFGVGFSGASYPLLSESMGSSQPATTELLDIHGSDFSFSQSGFGGSIRLDASIPTVNTSFTQNSSYAGGTLATISAEATTANPFLSISGDIDGMLVELAKRSAIPNVRAGGYLADALISNEADIDIGPIGLGPASLALHGDIDWDLLDIDATVGLKATQRFSFLPSSVWVTMTSNLGETHTGVLGDSFYFSTPDEGDGYLTVNASYSLHGMLRNQTGIVGHASGSISALDVSAGASGTISLGSHSASLDGSTDFGPYSYQISGNTSPIYLFDRLTDISSGFGDKQVSYVIAYADDADTVDSGRPEDLPTDNRLVNGLGGPAGYGERSLAPNDDGSTGFIDLTSVFDGGINLFGTSYSGLYLNNNGNLTFAGPLGTYTPFAITGQSTPMIAAFFADVDTRNRAESTGGSNLAWYDLDAANGVFTATWDHVGYFASHNDKENSFQIQLVDMGSGNLDIIYRYQNLEWVTGDASGGQNGFGGIVASAGYTAGDGSNYFQLPQSFNQSAMLGLDATPGNTGNVGVWRFSVDSGTNGNDVLSARPNAAGGSMLFGGEGDDVLLGGSADDQLYDGPGRDLLYGGGGNDAYLLTDDLNDLFEDPEGGVDTVQTAQHFSLARRDNFENLTLTGTGNYSGVGNGLSNRIEGNSGNNYLDGGDGADILIGGAGNDTYVIDRYSDQIIETGNDTGDTLQGALPTLLTGRPNTAGIENLTLGGTGFGRAVATGTGDNVLNGNSGVNVLMGGAGNDVLNGHGGRDILSGGAGADCFVFDVFGTANADRVLGFNAGDGDQLVLDLSAFGSLGGNGLLDADELALGATAADANDFLIFDSLTGCLYFDADGDGAGAQQLLATLPGVSSLMASNFLTVEVD